MIHRINSIFSFDLRHNLLGNVIEGTSSIIHSIRAISKLGLEILVKAAHTIITYVTFRYCTPVFMAGLCIGLVFDDWILKEVVNKVQLIFHAHRTFLETILFVGAVGLGAIYTMPITINCIAFYQSSKFSATYLEKCRQRKLRNEMDQVETPRG